MRVAVVHGPNLNLLGSREPDIYGRLSLSELNARITAAGADLGTEIECHQANGEGELVDFIQEAAGRVDGFVVNAGGYSHTSVAVLDALVGVGRPYAEVHISNLAGRERFRRHSLLSPQARGVVMGFGPDGYELALQGLVRSLRATGTTVNEVPQKGA